MTPTNILELHTREVFRAWLADHHATESECWMAVKKGKNPPAGFVRYLDSVEEALCFGWIDTTHKVVDGVDLQRFTPRGIKSPWSELNKERCRRLEKLRLMTNAGRAALPDMRPEAFSIDADIMQAFATAPEAWEFLRSCPPLYQRVRIDSIQ